MYPDDIPFPDISASIKPERNMERVQFGDGYFQLVSKGIHDLKITRSLSWKLLREEGMAFYTWLESVYNKTPFIWTYPHDKPRKYLCTELSMEDSDRIVSIKATFEEVFVL